MHAQYINWMWFARHRGQVFAAEAAELRFGKGLREQLIIRPHARAIGPSSGWRCEVTAQRQGEESPLQIE